jgi:hypothetical protein
LWNEELLGTPFLVFGHMFRTEVVGQASESVSKSPPDRFLP